MSSPRKRPNSRLRPLTLGYVRVSTADQVDNGASLDAQRTALTEEAGRRGWDLELVADEGLSAKNMNRPALQAALARLDHGDADALLSVRLDRISRSVADFAALLDRAEHKGWGLVLLSPALDLADPAGQFVANVLASAAQYERKLISARTREGMAQRKLDSWTGGRPAGRPRVLNKDVRDQIVAAHTGGRGWSAIARELNAAQVPTARGGAAWYPSTVRAAFQSTEV